MNFSSEDEAIIKKALKTATAHTADHHAVFQYQKVLQKLQENKVVESPLAQQDGFRCDYDDSEEV
jgi:hypothetical protein